MNEFGTAPIGAGTSTEPVRNQLGTGAVSAPYGSFRTRGPEPVAEPLPPITLPWRVLVADNQRHGLCRGRILLTAKYREALSAASMLCALTWKRPALKSSVTVHVTLYEPDKRRRDIGNYTKLIADALTRVAFVDDSQIDELHLSRGPLDRANPRAEITVTPL